MLPTFLAAVTWIPSLVGLGAIVRHRAEPRLRFALAGLLGLGVAGVVALWANFAVGVTPALAAGLWIAGLALAIARRRWILEAFDARDALAAVAVVAAASTALRHPAFQYDTGYYHLQALQWIARGPVPLGLANVHFRLGFNSLWHLVAAALEHPLVAGRSYAFLNVLPVAFAAAAGVAGVRGAVAGDGRVSTLLLAGSFLPAASAVIALGGLYSDYTAAVYAYVAIACWARVAERGDDADAAPAMLLSLMAALVKLSAAVLPAAGLLLLAVRRRAVSRGTWAAVGAAVAASVLPWAARGFVQSGCLAFPVASTCVPSVRWAVPEGVVAAVSTSIRAWARLPGLPPDMVLADYRWLPVWGERVLLEYPEALPMLWAFCAGLVGCAFARGPRRGLLAAGALALAGGAAWFLQAPDPRFGLGYLWALSLAPAAYVAAAGMRRVPRRSARLGVALLPAVAALVLASTLRHQERDGMAFGMRRWTPEVAEWPGLPDRTDVEPLTTRAGLRVFVPARGDRCWNAPVPCTPREEYRAGLAFDGAYFIPR